MSSFFDPTDYGSGNHGVLEKEEEEKEEEEEEIPEDLNHDFVGWNKKEEEKEEKKEKDEDCWKNLKLCFRVRSSNLRCASSKIYVIIRICLSKKEPRRLDADGQHLIAAALDSQTLANQPLAVEPPPPPPPPPVQPSQQMDDWLELLLL